MYIIITIQNHQRGNKKTKPTKIKDIQSNKMKYGNEPSGFIKNGEFLD
jgi:hypothetical protein